MVFSAMTVSVFHPGAPCPNRRSDIGVTVQQVTKLNCPDDNEIHHWIALAIPKERGSLEVTVRIVDEMESAELNQTYRHRAGATNVLAFPFQAPLGLSVALLGDLVLCAPLVESEARTQVKPITHHWAHLVIHGTLHLLGYDHMTLHQARLMETEERRLLAMLSIPDPYEIPNV